MKRKFTSLLLLLALVTTSVFAQYTTDGLYTIQVADESKYMSEGTPGSPMPMITSVTDDAKFYIVENTATPGMYNIISLDQVYLASSSGSYGTLIENTEANRNSTTSGALVDLISETSTTGIQSTPGGVLKSWNGNRGTNTQVGMGNYNANAPSGYQWNLVRIGDMPASGVPVVSITSPESGTEVLPSASVDLEATASALDGATVNAVEFLVDDVKVGDGVYNATSEVWEYTWAGNATEATYAITAKATSSTSQVTTSDSINVIVATNPAAATLTWPSEATTILPNKQITLKAEASPATGNTISKVEFFEGSNLIGEGTLSGEVYELDTFIPEINTFSITAKVTDSESNEASSAAVDLTTSLTTSIKSLYLNFESGDAATDWAWQSGHTIAGATWAYEAYDANKARSAANKVLAFDFSAGSGDGAKNIDYMTSGLDALPATGMVYIKLFYADDNDAAAPVAGPTLWSSALKPTPGTAAANDDGTFKADIWNKTTSAMGANGTDVTIYPAIRMDVNNTPGKIFFDDIVMYYDPNSSGTDATAPTAPNNLTVPNVEATQVVINWEEGMDVGIGIAETFILRTTTNDDAPELIDYVGYSANGLPEGLDAVGNWTVLGSVPLGTKTFTDNTVTDGNTGSYVYAVVHKDYAYNYSDAATITNGGVTQLAKAQSSLNCYGVNGAVKLESLPLGQALSIYSLSGAKVMAAQIVSSDMTVALPQGIYVVKAANSIQKVLVK